MYEDFLNVPDSDSFISYSDNDENPVHEPDIGDFILVPIGPPSDADDEEAEPSTVLPVMAVDFFTMVYEHFKDWIDPQPLNLLLNNSVSIYIHT